MTDKSKPDTAAAVITSGTFHRRLTPGESLLFGRARGNDLRIGHSPEDLRVPRTAGRLECRDGGALIHNLSDKRTLLVSTFPGPGYDVLPLMVAGTNPHPQVRISLTGNAAKYLIVVDVRELQQESPSPSTTDEAAATIGFRRLADMNPRHRLFLSALCLPLMTASGARGQLPTYAGMERILAERGYHYKAKTIRNNLDDLRQWLTYEHDVPELLAGDNEHAGVDRIVDKLAHWAIRSGNVTDADLEWLDENGAGGRGTGDDDWTH